MVIWLSFDRVHRLSQQTLTLPRCSMMLQIQPTASADETRQVRGAVSSEMGAVWMRNVLSSGGFVWGLLHGSCGTWAYLRREPGCSLGQCWRRSSDLLQAWPGGMPPTWVAAVAVAQEHGALFYFGFGPVQGRGKMLLVQNSDMVPRQLSRKLWDIRISLRVGRDEGTHVAQVLRGSLAYPGGTYHPGAGPRVQGLLGRQGSTVEGTKEHTTGG